MAVIGCVPSQSVGSSESSGGQVEGLAVAVRKRPRHDPRFRDSLLLIGKSASLAFAVAVKRHGEAAVATASIGVDQDRYRSDFSGVWFSSRASPSRTFVHNLSEMNLTGCVWLGKKRVENDPTSQDFTLLSSVQSKVVAGVGFEPTTFRL